MTKIQRNALTLTAIAGLLGGQLLLMNKMFDGSDEVEPLAEEQMVTVSEEESSPKLPPVEAESVVAVTTPPDEPEPVVEAPFVEKTGGEGMVEERLAANDGQVPEETVDVCAHFLPKTLDEEMRAKAKQGPAKAGFTIEFDGFQSPWSVMLAERMPGESITFEVTEGLAEPHVTTDGGVIESLGDDRWRWDGPEEPGIYCVHIEDGAVEDRVMCLHVAILTPYQSEPELNGYKIGEYKAEPFQGKERYLPPQGFIEVNEETQNLWVSPHFQLKQFACKQSGGFPKYMRLQTRLLLKLELLIAGLREEGVETDSLYVLSGFRTPWYNRAIGNKTFYSRHLFGDAADLLVDTNRDGDMDDVDGSGRVTGDDARVLYNVVGNITREHKHLVGGLGFYDTTNYRNPFIHTDTRGYPARWKK